MPSTLKEEQLSSPALGTSDSKTVKTENTLRVKNAPFKRSEQSVQVPEIVVIETKPGTVKSIAAAFDSNTKPPQNEINVEETKNLVKPLLKEVNKVSKSRKL
ncbi:hypothetical protein RF11_13172 [Thelohanellus kitauei]|uniref:Uncharacterized protein n=1 Tax=Thelohanellus kitauei TaxID=669202 RepID=A0A0C2N3J9_THEKT|nr:hypothetical protein RF11_13172 [Thelohanellus kitauei]